MSVDFITFGLIIDDIVAPDGQTIMGVLGGGGPQTAFGMRVWSDSVGLVGGLGADAPNSVREWLDQSGVDTQGIRTTEFPTLRAWQVMEPDGRRTQVWRMPVSAIDPQIGRTMERIPSAYRNAKGYHFGIHPDEPDLDFIRELRKERGLVSIEPFMAAQHGKIKNKVRGLLTECDIFSPNYDEAISLVGECDPIEALRRLNQTGSPLVALRCGGKGSWIADASHDHIVYIPAVKVDVVDPVGAGNAYCGGFVVGWEKTHDAVTAGLYGAVSASFLVEHVGPPVFHPEIRDEANRRLAAITPGVTVQPLSIKEYR
jgi:sugar/nucleoside kinase (ribokinase family)